MKWTCGLYECKPYDAKEWAKLGLEIGTVNNWLGLGRSMANLKDGTKVVAEDGASYTYHAPPADDFTNDKTGAVATKPVTAGSIGASEPYHASDLQAIRGGKPLSYAVTYSEKSTGDTLGTFYVYDKTAFDKTYGDALKNLKTDKYFNAVETNPYLYNLQQMNGIVQALPGDDWIVNPYRSTRYDALCYPAQLYNTRKEKQLKCIELKCIQENAQTGLPITQCEEKYSAQTCLYLESAQARLHGSIGDILQRAVAGIALQIITAYGVQTFVHSVCGDYRPDQVQQWGPLSKGVVAVGCGLIGAFTNLQELKSFKDSLRSQNPTVPQGQDYCTGVDGVQPDSTAGN